ncbi:GNAT family N-acetyltransferase [Microbacterium sp. P06]|uniref:GNAT family N-acetyltransferase n=1 Tax=unclassified Microbacterium TaxID=2609290 RepID=UPI003745B3A5
MPESAGLAIRTLDTVDGVHAASRLFDEVWPGERSTMPANILRALEHAGNYVVGVYEGERMLAASAAFFGAPAARTLHSHITGVLPEAQGRGIGRAVKLHQRAWAREREIDRITWTFDPLIARNAHFNLTVLGGGVADYLVDQYGQMGDDVNRGDASDRLLVSWAVAGSPPLLGEVVAAVQIPRDIGAIRATSPEDAAEWRLRVRESLLAALADGLRVGGFDVERGYLLTR